MSRSVEKSGVVQHEYKVFQKRLISEFVSLYVRSCVFRYQYDKMDPTNPWGLLIAYAEEKIQPVKPVASDFDASLVLAFCR